MGRLTGKRIIIVGGGTGIGAATALRLAEEGAAVAVSDLDTAAAQDIAGRIAAAGGRALGMGADITDEAAVKALVARAAEAFGGLDGIHVNAADLQSTHADTDAVDVPLEIYDRTLAVNLRGHLLCTRHAVPALLASGGGAIVYTGSGSGVTGEPMRVAYGISKHGQVGLMRHVAARWGKQGIRANVVAPGFTIGEGQRRRMSAEKIAAIEADFCRRSPTTRAGRPTDIAAMVAMLLSDDGQWINGQILSVDGGYTMR
jgi:NAD(P)-dependent dehydrogenase (short-subunit alcohol dehydrogenase family)